MRLLTGLLAGQGFVSRLVGDPSLSRRPMRRVIEPLERMGGRVEATDGHAPLTIHGAALHGTTHRFEVPSAQVKSAVLLAGLHADGSTTVVEPAQTRDHTERALATFGADIATRGDAVSVAGRQALTAQSLSIPGDFSSAAFWMVAAAALPGSRSLGIAADERPDGFVVGGPPAGAGHMSIDSVDGSTSSHQQGLLSGGTADARGDHRMAMAFAIAALGGRLPSRILGADSVSISYPA